MEDQSHKMVHVAYELYTTSENEKEKLVEKAPGEHPFQFITGMGVALDAFEAFIEPLAKGEKFDFTLSSADGYGDYDPLHVISLDKKMFCIDGHFDKENIFPGNIIPLVNEDGQRFNAIVLEIKEDKVILDLNHPLAGKSLHFKGSVIESRPASEDEIQGLLNRLSGEDSCCHCNGDCNGEHHHCHHEEDGHNEHKCGCGHCH